MDRERVFDPDELVRLGLEVGNDTIKTFNATGYMRNYLGEFSRKVCDDFISDEHRFLEIGSGIGNVLKVLIRKGAKHIVSVDSDQHHLDILTRLLSEESKQHPDFTLETVHDSLPEVSKLGNRTFDRIVCCQVLHYLMPSEFETALSRLSALLSPGGRILITVGSPYIKVYEGFDQEYEARMVAGEPFPGLMENPRQYHPNGLNHHPGHFLFFDPVNLSDHVTGYGLRVLEAHYEDVDIMGPEATGLIAEKP